MFKVGDKVTPRPDERVPRDSLGRVFTVAKVNPRNLKCTADDGGRGINFPAELLVPATEENVKAGRAPVGRPFEPREVFHEGTIVTLKRAYRDWTTDIPLVVTKEGPKNINVAKLGGGTSQYMRVPPAGLVRRDMEWLTESLVERA